MDLSWEAYINYYSAQRKFSIEKTIENEIDATIKRIEFYKKYQIKYHPIHEINKMVLSATIKLIKLIYTKIKNKHCI